MKKTHILILSIVILIIISYYTYSFREFKNEYGTQGIGNMDQTYNFINKDGDYSISIPVAWKVHEINTAPDNLKYLTETMSTSNPRAFINISKSISNSSSTTELLSYLEIYKKGLDQLLEITDEELVIADNKGFLIEYTYLEHLKIGDYKNHCYDWIMPQNIGYIFIFCVDDAIWEYGKPMFLRMIESIKIK